MIEKSIKSMNLEKGFDYTISTAIYEFPTCKYSIVFIYKILIWLEEDSWMQNDFKIVPFMASSSK